MTLTNVVYGKALPGTAEHGVCGPAMRHRDFDELLAELPDGVRTTYDCWQRGVRISGDRPCMGVREVVDGTPGKYKWLTYAEANARAVSIGCGFLAMGLVESQSGNVEDLHTTAGRSMVGIYAQNCPEWVLCEQGANAFSICVVPLYDSLGPDACRFIVDHTQMEVVCCSRTKTSNLLQSPGKSLKVIVQFEEPTDEERGDAEAKGLRLFSLDEVLKAGQENPREPFPPTPSMLATICYTSGTTGDPKGAMLPHRALVADACGVKSSGFDVLQDDVHISYLPLAHMFERMVQVTCWFAGASVGFFRGDVLLLMDDICELRPTLFPSVPRLFNRIHDKVLAGVRKAGGVKEKMFNTAYEAKRQHLKNGHVTHKVWDRVVFSSVKARLGGRVRVMVTGSAPIAANVLEFLRIAFCCHVVEGYGQTESGAASTITQFGDTSSGHVGGPMACNDIKLVDVPEMGYLTIDDPPRGEVCFRGPNCFAGYYRDAVKTKEAIDDDGWLHSGDIGEWLPNGALRVIDRKKNIFKLAQGEYVAAEKIENIYTTSELVAQAFVHGNSLESTLVAVVVPDPDAARAWAEQNNKSASHSDLCADPEFHTALHASMNAAGKTGKLRGFECVKEIYVEAAPFSTENGLLTPTFKLKRPQAKTKYKTQIDAMYTSINSRQ